MKKTDPTQNLLKTCKPINADFKTHSCRLVVLNTYICTVYIQTGKQFWRKVQNIKMVVSG